MPTKLDTRQSVNRAALPMVGSAANASLDTILPIIDAEISKLYEDRNITLADGGLITLNAAGTSVSFTQSLKLHINSKVAGGAPVVIDLASTSRAFSANLRMLYAVIDRLAGTATVTADATTLPAVTSANQEVVLIAKRIDSSDGSVRVIFREGSVFFAGQSKRLGNMDFAQWTSAVDAATTGANATIATVSTGVVRLTNVSLTSISGIPNGLQDRMLFLQNKTGVDVTINNDEATAAASDRIYTGTGGNITLKNNSMFIFCYDFAASRWVLAGGSGSGEGGGSGSLDTLFTQTFETAVLGDFTQVGLVIDSTLADLINGEKTAKLVHDSVTVQSFKQTIELPQKYQSFTNATRNLSITLWARSDAAAGNVTLEIRDETNNVLISTETITTITTENANENLFSFDVPLTCESISYKVSALAESGSPETFIDDISIFLTPSELVQTLLFQEDDSIFSAGTFTGMTLASTNTGVFYFPTYTIRQNVGDAYNIQQSATLGTSIQILKEGVHRFNFGYNPNTAQRIMYITRNATVLTAAPVTNLTEIIASKFTDSPTNTDSWSITGEAYCYVGDVIRFQLSGSSNIENTGTSADGVTCAYQGVLKQINTNPDSKIVLPKSTLRMSGANTRGGTATAIVRFDSVSRIIGDAFTVASDATLGTRITMAKAGKVTINVSLVQGVSGGGPYISKNQAVLTALPVNAETLAAATGTNEFVSTSWTGNLQVGDVIRVSSTQNPTADNANNIDMYFEETDINVSVTNIQPKFSEGDSSVRVDTANGYGSTANKIRRFANIRHNLGVDISYVDSATNGGSFTVLSDGIYNISYSEQVNAFNVGISRNADAFLTTAILTLAQDVTNTNLVLAQGGDAGSGTENCSWQGFLSKGDIIRAHTDGNAAVDNENCRFTISKVGKPNITEVDVTPFVTIPTQSYGTISDMRATSSILDGSGEIRFALGAFSQSGDLIVAVSDDVANTRTKFTAVKRCAVSASWLIPINNSGNVAYIYKNGNIVSRGSHTAAPNYGSTAVYETILEAGEFLTFGASSAASNSADLYALSINAEATPDAILQEVETFSSDTAPFVYAGSATYTLATLQNAPIGTFITFTYAANTNTRTQTNAAAPTQTTSSMNVNGIEVFARSYTAASTTGQPAAVAVQIGKGFKGLLLNLFKSSGKVTGGELDCGNLTVSNTQTGLPIKSYDPTTGILLIDAGYQANQHTAGTFVFNDLSTQASGFITINASKNPALAGLLVPKRYFVSYKMTASTAAGVNFSATLALSDNCGAWNGTEFTAPATGTYRCRANTNISIGAGGGYSMSLYKDGTLFTGLSQWGNGPAGGSNQPSNGEVTLDLVKGQKVSFRLSGSATVSYAAGDFGTISIESLEIRG